MTISVDFGSAPGGTVGYQFFDATGLLGSRVTTGISNPRVGIYYKASVTPDAGAIGVYWDDGTINATEVFETNPQPADVYSFQSSAITSGAFASGAIHATAVDTGAIRSDCFASGAINGAAVASDALSNVTAWTVAITGNITGSLSGSVGSVTGNIGGTLTSSERNAIADAMLNRDMSAVSDTNSRSPLNALRFVRNKWSVSGTTLTVTKEDDATSAWTSTVTTSAGADPITGNDPA